jgi:hypothetical protein
MLPAGIKPHVAIGQASREYQKKTFAEAFEAFILSPGPVSVCRLGN